MEISQIKQQKNKIINFMKSQGKSLSNNIIRIFFIQICMNIIIFFVEIKEYAEQQVQHTPRFFFQWNILISRMIFYVVKISFNFQNSNEKYYLFYY